MIFNYEHGLSVANINIKQYKQTIYIAAKLL